jgi:broad specificity phosphatase PhoE
MASPDQDCVLVYVVRHGETVLNAQNAFRGNKNVPLNDSGKADAQNLADIFKDVDISHIISSDRTRAKSTAAAIASKKKQPVHLSANLRALDVGKFSGEKRNKENVEALQHYIDNPDEEIPGGESLSTFKSRIDPCLAEAIDLAIESESPVLLVAHSSVVHEVGAMIKGRHQSVLVKPGGYAIIYINDSGKVDAKPVYRTDNERMKLHAETIS